MVQNSSILNIIRQDIQVTRDVAIATIFATIEGDYVEVHGTAKRHPDDRSNSRVAALVAYNNALGSLHSKVNKRAMGAVKHADDMAQLRKSNKKTKRSASKRR